MNSEQQEEDMPWNPGTRGRWTWREWLTLVVFVALVAYIVAGVVGCTVTPATVAATGASFDGNAKDSGFKGWAPDGSGILSPTARDRYVALVKLYGGAFVPVLRPGDGLREQPDGTWLIDKEHLTRFGEMAALGRMGAAPQPP